MIPRRILLTVMTILLLLSTFAYSNPDSTGTRNDTVAIQVLEERVKGNAEKTQNQVEALQKLLEAQNEAVNQRITDLDEASQRQTSIILVMAGFFLTLSIAVVTFFGHRAITGWIKQSISDKTDALIEQHKTGLAEQAKKASEEWARVDKARDEYESLKERLEKKAKEIAKLERPLGEPDEKTPEFQDKLTAVKDEGDYTAKDWFLLGYEASERSDYKEAVRGFSHSIELDSNSYWGYNNRGYCYGIMERHSEALDDFDRAIEIGPERPEAYYNRGLAHENMGLYDEALKNYHKTIELDPQNSYAYNNRGTTLSKLRLYNEALEDYDKAIAFDPENATAYINRGKTLTMLRHYDKALQSYDIALKLEPDDLTSLQNSAEVNIFLDQHAEALKQASKAVSMSKTSRDKAASLYLKCIAEKLSGKDTSATEVEFERILKENFVCDWSFDEIERWLEKAKISKEERQFIVAKIAKFKAKKKKK